MVKVTSDVLDDAALKKMGIISVPGRGQGFNYYITDVDRRNGSEFQKQIIDDMVTASKIWKNKPGCWQDHFRRSTRFQTYGMGMDKTYGTDLTGYKLAIQVLMDSLKIKDSTYYDPPCYCIIPIDWVSEPPHTKTVFDYQTSNVVSYHYNAVKQPDNYVGCLYNGKDPFISAAYATDGIIKKLFLANAWSIPRSTHLASDHWKWEDFKDPVMWPPIYIVDEGEYWKTGARIWDCCLFRWIKRGPCECTQDGTLIKCIDGYYVPPNLGETLCGRERVKFKFKYTDKNMGLIVESTGGPPYKDIYLEDRFLGTIGLGNGEGKTAAGSWGFSRPIDNNFINIGVVEHNEPCPFGKTKCNSPHGKTYTLSPLSYDRVDPCEGDIAASRHVYTYILPEPIQFNADALSPEFRIVVNGPFYDDRGFQNWYPWGGVRIEASANGVNYTPLYTGVVAFNCSPNVTEYCYNNWVITGEIRFIKVWISNSTLWGCCTQTTLAGLELLDKLTPAFSD